MAIQFCAVPLKLRKTCPGMETRIAVSNKIKKLEDDIRLMTDDLNKKMKDLPVIEKKHTDEMNTVENNIKKWISSVE